MVELELPPEETGQDEQAGKKGKAPKAKKEKTPKPPKAPKAKKTKQPPKPPKAKKGAPKPPKEKSGKGGSAAPFLLAALLVALLLVGGGLMLFDLLGARTAVINTLAALDPAYKDYMDMQAGRDTALNEREADIAAKEKELQQREDKVVSSETRLNKRTTDLDTREQKLLVAERAATPAFRREISAEKLAELKNLGKIYSQMDAEAAAGILTQLYGPIEMAEVLFYMDKTAAAAVLAALDPKLAAQITDEMLRE